MCLMFPPPRTHVQQMLPFAVAGSIHFFFFFFYKPVSSVKNNLSFIFLLPSESFRLKIDQFLEQRQACQCHVSLTDL